MRLYIWFWVTLFSVILFNTEAQNTPYHIEIKVNQLQDTTLILGHYFNKQMFVNDTVAINHNGIAVFEGKKPLPGGIYVIYLPNKHYFDLLIDTDQSFKVSVDTTDFVNSMTVTGAQQTQLFNQYQRFLLARQKEAGNLQNQLKKANGNSDQSESIKQKLKELTNQVKNYWDNITQKYPGTMLALFVKGIQDVKVPEMKPPQGCSNPDSVLRIKRYQYYKSHYFDNLNLTDQRILKTPFFTARLENYFQKIVIQSPDTLLSESKKIIEKARPNAEVFRYLVQYLFNMANDSQIMGMDAVVVGLAEKYYLSGEATWADESFLKDLSERVDELKPTLIGQKAHDLKMPSPQNEFFRLHEITAPITLIMFWEPECGHCKKEVPALHNLLKNQLAAKGVRVFAVYTQSDKEEWNTFINEHHLYDFINVYDPLHQTQFRSYYDIKSTPIVYVLDKNKTIIGKRIAIKDLPGFIDHHLKYGQK